MKVCCKATFQKTGSTVPAVSRTQRNKEQFKTATNQNLKITKTETIQRFRPRPRTASLRKPSVARVRESFNTKRSSDLLDFTTLRTISKQMKRDERRGSVIDSLDGEEAVEFRTKCTFSDNHDKAHTLHHQRLEESEAANSYTDQSNKLWQFNKRTTKLCQMNYLDRVSQYKERVMKAQ